MTTSNITIKRLSSEDQLQFAELIKLFEDVFEMEKFTIPSSAHLQRVLDGDGFFVFVAMTDGKVVGGLTTYVLSNYYGEKPYAYIFDLAVSTKLQRQGIGRKLIAATKKYYTEQGFEEVFVQANLEDGYALDFYRSTSPTEEEQAVHFSYLLGR